MNEVTVREASEVNAFEMKPKTLEQAMKFCEIMADSTLVPKDYQGKPGNIMVAIQLGHELGLSPLRSLKSIAVINGRATIWGDELMAMVLANPTCEYVDESESTEKEGVCRVKRKGHPEHTSRFTLEDAKRAGLLGKQGPWTQYTSRMLKLRARGFALRDKFADALAGLVTTEEAIDLPAEPPAMVETPPLTTLKDKLKAKRDHAASSGAAPTDTPPSQSEHSDAHQNAPDDTAPALTAANVVSQLALCEMAMEFAQVMNQWEAEKHLHTKEEQAEVEKMKVATKRRIGIR